MKRTDKISESEVTLRLIACCKAAGIETIGELIDIPKMELIKYRNFGKRSLAEVDEIRKVIEGA